MVQVLKQSGDNLTRENVMRQAANLKDFHPAMLLKGINMNTGPTDYQPIGGDWRCSAFNGERFEVFGELLSAPTEFENRDREFTANGQAQEHQLHPGLQAREPDPQRQPHR